MDSGHPLLLAEIVTPEGSIPHSKHEEVCEEHRKLQSQQEVRRISERQILWSDHLNEG
jgi:hypothetical protein